MYSLHLLHGPVTHGNSDCRALVEHGQILPSFFAIRQSLGSGCLKYLEQCIFLVWGNFGIFQWGPVRLRCTH